MKVRVLFNTGSHKLCVSDVQYNEIKNNRLQNTFLSKFLVNKHKPSRAKQSAFTNIERDIIFKSLNLYRLSISTIHQLTNQDTHIKLRQRYWIRNGKSFIRKSPINFKTCQRHYTKHHDYPKSLSLIALRTQDWRAFRVSDIDNFGPIYVKDIYLRR